MRAGVAVLLAATALGAGCGRQDKPVADDCVDGSAPLLRALRSAPGHVALADGTTLADCVGSSSNPADLQNVGATFTATAADLSPRARRDPRAALELGFLVGATDRGAKRTAGFQAELVNRMISFVADERLRGPERTAAMRGLAAGRSHG